MPQRKKTVSEHIRDGTYRKGRHGSPKPTGKVLDTLPEPPSNLDGTAKNIYETVGGSLIAQGVLKYTDLMMLATYAREAGIYEQESEKAAQEIVTVLNNGVTCVSHHRRAAETALKNMVLLGDRLGLSPKARFSMAAHAPPIDARERQRSILDLVKGGTLKKTGT